MIFINRAPIIMLGLLCGMVGGNWSPILCIMVMIKLKSILTENITDSPEFKRWFGHSQVVDKHGNPMVVFHVTKSLIQKFSHKRIGHGSTVLGNYEVERYGIFAAEDARMADEFARAGDYEHEKIFNHSIIPLYMRIESPLDTTKVCYSDALFNTVEEWGDKNGMSGYHMARILGDRWGSKMWLLFDKDDENDPEIWIRMFKDLDYDGIRLYERSEIENNISWMAFDPDQVKSAIGNIGRFDRNDLDIMKETIR